MVSPSKILQKTTVSLAAGYSDDNQNTKDILDISYPIQKGSVLHNALSQNYKHILGCINNIFIYNADKPSIELAPQFKKLIALSTDIDLTQIHSLNELNHKLQNTVIRFGKIQIDGKIVERWHDLPQYIPKNNDDENLKNTLLLELGFSGEKEYRESDNNPSDYFVPGAHCKRMNHRIQETLLQIQSSNAVPDTIILLGSTREIITSEIEFLQSLDINTQEIVYEHQAQYALFNHYIKQYNLGKLENKIIPIIAYGIDGERPNTNDTLNALKQKASEQGLSFETASVHLEPPYQRIGEQLANVIREISPNVKLNLYQSTGYDNPPDANPIKSAVNEAFGIFDIANRRITNILLSNISYPITKNSSLYQKLNNDPAKVLGRFNNIFVYDRETLAIKLSPAFKQFIQILIHDLGQNIDLSEEMSFSELNHKLGNIKMHFDFGKQLDENGKPIERWTINDQDISKNTHKQLHSTLVALGFYAAGKNIQSTDNISDCFINGATSPCMLARIKAAMDTLKNMPDRIILLSSSRKLMENEYYKEKTFLQSLGIENVEYEYQAQLELLHYYANLQGLDISNTKIICAYKEGRTGTMDALEVYNKRVKENTIPVAQVVYSSVELPYGNRLLDYLTTSIGDENTTFNLVQTNPYNDKPTAAPLKSAINEVIKQFNAITHNIEGLQ